MNKKEFIYLTEVVTVLSEKGEKRLNKLNDKEDDDEHDFDFYDRLGLRPPKGIKENREDSNDDYIQLKEDEFTYQFVEIIVDLQKIYKVTNVDDFGSILELDNGEAVRIEETVEDVFFIIAYAQRGWFEKLKKSVSVFFRRIKGKKKVDLEELPKMSENNIE